MGHQTWMDMVDRITTPEGVHSLLRLESRCWMEMVILTSFLRDLAMILPAAIRGVHIRHSGIPMMTLGTVCTTRSLRATIWTPTVGANTRLAPSTTNRIVSSVRASDPTSV